MEKIKIIQFVTSLSMGGAEQLVKEYSMLLDKAKFDVTVLAIWHKGVSPNEIQLKNAGIRVLFVNDELRKGSGIVTRVLRKLERKRYIKEFIEREKPNVIHAHLGLLEYLAHIPLKKWGVKVFYTCHNTLSDTFGDKKSVKCAKSLIKNNDMQMIALHKDMSLEINHLFGISNCLVLNNGIDFDLFRKNEIWRQETREKLSIPKDGFVIGHVGRFTRQKNQSFLVKLFSYVALKNDRAYLLMIGDGEDKEKIEASIAELGLSSKVIILSNRDDIPQLMNAMDVFVFPSVFEGFGIVLVEAQAIGLRCIVSEAVSDYACLTPLVSKVSLDAGFEIWEDAIYDLQGNGRMKYSGIEEFNIRNIVKMLENIYEGV